jgi:transposase
MLRAILQMSPKPRLPGSVAELVGNEGGVAGIGPITASAIVATITDPSLFSSGKNLRQF